MRLREQRSVSTLSAYSQQVLDLSSGRDIHLTCCLVCFYSQMKNKRRRYVVKTLYRRYTSSASMISDDQKESQKNVLMQGSTMRTTLPSQAASSPPIAVFASTVTASPSTSPPAHPTPTFSPESASQLCAGRGRRKRPRPREASARPTNDLCEVCAEEPPWKKELLFDGCLHGMRRSWMTAHLEARRRCCHVCPVDFRDRLLEVGALVTIKHVVAESKKQSRNNIAGSEARGRRKAS